LAGAQWIQNKKIRRLRILCDNQQALIKCTEKPGHNSKEWDLRQVLYLKFSLFAGTIQKQHIYGHQDISTEWQQLPVEAQLNVQCDAIATAAREAIENGNQVPLLNVELVPGSVIIGGKTMSSLTRSSLYQALFQNQSMAYWCKRRDIPVQSLQLVDWEMIETAYTSLSPDDKREIFKLATENSPTRRQLSFRHQASNDLCVWCKQVDKSWHGLICPNYRDYRREQWKKVTSKLPDTTIQDSGITSWTPESAEGLPDGQIMIGGVNLFLGFFHRNLRMNLQGENWQRIKAAREIWTTTTLFSIQCYKYHVDQTAEKLQQEKNESIRQYILENWNDCHIPPDITLFHPQKTSIEGLMMASAESREQWYSTDSLYRQLE